MSADRSLEGKLIVITRAAHQARKLTEHLQAFGATVLLFPAINFFEPEGTTELDRAIASIEEFDWLLFTSANAVRFFARRARKAGNEPGRRAKPRCAAVGPATARAAAAEGYVVDYTAQHFLGIALAQELGAALAGKRVLLPRSSLAGRDVPDALAHAGALVTEVVAYVTSGIGAVEPSVLEAIHEGRVDMVSFFSPSAVEHVRRELGDEEFVRLGERAAMAAVGPVTAAALRKNGLAVAVQAAEATSESMAAEIVAYYSAHRAAKARSR